MTGQYSVSDAFNYGWKKFQQNWVPWVVAIVVFGLITVIIQFVNNLLWRPLAPKAELAYDPVTQQLTTTSSGISGGFFGTLIYFTLSWIIPAVVGWIISAQVVRAALANTKDGKIDFANFTRTELLGTVIVASLLAAIFTAIGILACFVGAIVVAFFIEFFAYFVLDRGEAPMQSIKSSFSFVNQHLANIIVLYLASILAIIIGAILCGVGLLIAIPVVALAHAYTYRVLSGQQVAA